MLLYGATMFLSAFLLFLIQPLIGKYILPWFGGTPAVWTTCMLFFQALLLGGYAYAHGVASRFALRRQALVHVVLLAVTILAVLWLSIIPSPGWKPMDGQSPVLRILGLLLVSIGAPYLILSSTAPLLQSWFGHARPGASPYRLYALSNLGSLLAILSYPLLVEPAISLSRQAALWSWAYAAFGLLCMFLSLRVLNIRPQDAGPDGLPNGEAGIDARKPGPGQYALWLSLTACSCLMLLATTSMMCQDLAVVPLLWILPLALYLLSFILCFQYERLYRRPLFMGGLAFSMAWTCFILFGGVSVALRWQILSYSLTLFLSCMVCHGELVRLRPATRHLTAFYLMVAGGGSLGGLLATVAAPHLLKGFWEYHIGLLATGLLALIVLFRDQRDPARQNRPFSVWVVWAVFWVSWTVLAVAFLGYSWKSWNFYVWLSAIVLMTVAIFLHDRTGQHLCGRPLKIWAVGVVMCLSWAALAFALGRHVKQTLQDTVEMRRDFFGVLRVLEFYKDDPAEHRLSLLHGRIEHGFQFQDEEKRRWPTSYYGPGSGIGLAINEHPRRLARQPLRIGVIGLGTGTLAALGRAGDYIRFYEINPEVLRLSDKYFTYRKDTPARVDVVLGDARVSMERERQRGEAQKFDVLAVDAFSSDAIPVHLLTREAFQIYQYHLKEDGILAMHITNRYFDLSPVVRNLPSSGAKPQLQVMWIDGPATESLGTDATDWVLVTANPQFLADPVVKATITPWKDAVPIPEFWTDDYTDLLHLLKERRNDY